MPEESPQRPAWQTEELQEEWIEEEPSDDDANNLTYGTRSISLTVPLPSHIHTNSDLELDADKSDSPTSFRAVGTFLVREDVPNVPMLPKTPGRGRTGIIKDFFSPLPLERMFEPPTPPMAPLPMPPAPAAEPGSPSDEIMETDLPNMVSFHGRKASLACQFTFAAPRGAALDPNAVKPSYPQAQSTPTPHCAPNTAAPATDPRLRLFQFQYDTFTREHLSALADSIAVNSPSGTGTRSGGRLSTVSEASYSDLRSTKRVKLSPPSDYGEGAGAGASIARPQDLRQGVRRGVAVVDGENQTSSRFLDNIDGGKRRWD
ncbi:Septation initiation network scaffold protein cdc11 [Mycena sanguinolenta]|uniref:Septation initiation network scaffold protein cdc11 n=1 Tax=Mycena sanguinolenta TaxID=230812 RepID=A0A8H6YG34_9AGAR|nr:Septation initiation network scaffold protein cdc11 [Mycena sanguinolenta]